MNDHDLRLYRTIIKQRDQEIDLLRTALIKFGDRARMSMAEPVELQQAIDRAFENTAAQEPAP